MPPDQTVQFQEERPPSFSGGQGTSDMMDRLVGWGVAQDRTQAQYILIGVAVVCFAAAGFFMFSGSSPRVSAPPLVNTVENPLPNALY